MSTTITIGGLGFSGSVEVEDGETYADALARAGFNSPDELDVVVNGEQIEDVDEVAVEADAEVTATG
jgi:sulfur carrier protein ThiS